MPRFHYSALSDTGDVITGEVDSPDAGAVIADLHSRALLPIHATEKVSSGGTFSVSRYLRLPRRTPRLSGHELALFSQQLARLLKAGLPLDRALDILMAVTGARASALVRRVLDLVRDGSSLSAAMAAQRGAFPTVYVSMIRAGEASGALQPVLARVADYLVRREEIRQRVVSAAIYPAILMAAATVSIGLVLTVVLPEFEPMFREAGASLPTSTRIVMDAGAALRQFWWAMLLALFGAVLLWRQAMRRPEVAGWRDRLLLRLPVAGGAITRYEVGRFCRTLGVLLAGGVAAPRALALGGAAVANRAIEAAIEDAATRFGHGEGLSSPLARTSRFPALSLQLIRIGEETGRLEEMLAEIADIYDQEVQRLLDRLLSMLVPAITIGMGILIALIIAAVMTAMISINDLAT